LNFLRSLFRSAPEFKTRLLNSLQTRDLEQLTETLLLADVGPKATEYLIEKIKKGPGAPAAILRQELIALLQKPVTPKTAMPLIIMVVGINGSGKTTTVAKLAYRFKKEGKRVLIAAADTYRDAAADQLSIWAEKAEVEIVPSRTGQDSAAVAFDAVARAKTHAVDVVLVDTAGRLQVRTDLMAEAQKIRRVLGKIRPDAPDEVLLVLDATVGQNGLSQARMFLEALSITGIIVCKLDGTAKAGILIPIAFELNLPIRYLGTGEILTDLEVFSARDFVSSLLD
jgi:fused signal recognition particle receptor